MKTIEERAQIAGQVYQFGKERIEADHKVYENGYIQGATEQKAIDEEIRLKKCDDMTESEYNHETAFVDWYLENGKGTPTYSDAIEWARKEVINKACDWLKARNVLTDASIEGFRRAMEE